ncbi:MAG TPA: Flp family type IVb pilin [Sphingomicrobium sp.]|nr:Flp family type IVb pilin [Sphingomicrobium sp.]
MRELTRILRDSRGATAIEYALVASLIAVAGMLGMQALGGNMNTMYGNVSNELK